MNDMYLKWHLYSCNKNQQNYGWKFKFLHSDSGSSFIYTNDNIFFLYLSSLQMDMDIILRLSILKKFCHIFSVWKTNWINIDMYAVKCLGKIVRVTPQFVWNIIRFVVASLIRNKIFFLFLNAMFGPFMNRFDLDVWL